MKHVLKLLTHTAAIPIPIAAKFKEVQKQNHTSGIHSWGAEPKSKLQNHD